MPVTAFFFKRHPIIAIEQKLYSAKEENKLIPTFQKIRLLLAADLYEEKVYKRIQKKCRLLFEAEMGSDYSFKRSIKRLVVAVSQFFTGKSIVAEYTYLQDVLKAKMAEAKTQSAATLDRIEYLVEEHLAPYFDGRITKATERCDRPSLIAKILPQLKHCTLSRNAVQQRILDCYFSCSATMLNRHYRIAKEVAEAEAKKEATALAEKAAKKAAEQAFDRASSEEARAAANQAASKACSETFAKAMASAKARIDKRFDISNSGAFHLIDPRQYVPEAAIALSRFCRQLIHAVGIDFKNLALSSDEIRRKAYESVQELYDEEKSIRGNQVYNKRKEKYALERT